MNISELIWRPFTGIVFILFFSLCFVSFAHADVIFSEIAWMGTDEDANNEWIEIYNFSSEMTDLTGWTLSDGNSLQIDLSGIMPPHGVFLLERTDDTTVPDIPASIIYTGALTNSGATLTIKDANGTVAGQPLVGGDNWVNIGGDNELKYTAQMTTTGQWVTGHPTPGLPNITADELPENNNDDNNDISSSAQSLHLIPRTLESNVDAIGRVYVNQEVSMNIDSSGLSESILRSLTHEWNFGDFTVGSGKEVTHRFAYPGEYVVTVRSHYKEYESIARKEVVVLPVSFSLTTNENGDVQVHNDARYEVDVSGYKIVAGRTLKFPAGTILLPNATITIPKEKLQYSDEALVALYDDVKTHVASLHELVIVESSLSVQRESAKNNPAPIVVPIAYTPPTKEVIDSGDLFSFSNSEDVGMTVTTTIISQVDPGIGTQNIASIEAAEKSPKNMMPYFALLAVIGIGGLSVFAGRSSRKKVT